MAEHRVKVASMFIGVAQQLARGQASSTQSAAGSDTTRRLADAEKIYLMLGEVDRAIDMYKEAAHYDDMVRLIRVHHPDLVENSLIMLSAELEARGQLEQAERYLLMASEGAEWKNVVRMYRNANRWPGAYRVCVSHEPATLAGDQTPVRVQVAYWWSKSLGSIDEALRLLTKSIDGAPAILQAVLNYAIECKNFEYALALAKSNDYKQLEGGERASQLARIILVKYANWLEQQGQLAQAERFLVDAGQLDDAIDMYMENGRFGEALATALSWRKCCWGTLITW